MRTVVIFALSTTLSSIAAAPASAADLAAPRAPPGGPGIFDRYAKVEPPPGPSVPGGDIFGYTSPTDIGDPCSWGLASENSARAGKRDGRYLALSSKTQLAYTYSDRVAFAAAAFTSHQDWSNVTVAQDALAGAGDGALVTSHRGAAFDGISGEIAVRLLARSRGQPFAVTVAAEPRWSRIDALTGWRAEGHGVELKLFADVALADWLFAAANANYALGRQRFEIPNATWAESSSRTVSGALTAQLYAAEKGFVEGVFVGVEGRFLSAFEGLGLNRNVGNALFAGPTAAIAFTGGRMLNVVWTPQVSGRARPDPGLGALDLDNFERHEFRVKFSTAIGG